MKIQHPMIISMGEIEFKKVLDSLPEYYSLEYNGNFKPIGMQIIWERRYLSPFISAEERNEYALLTMKAYLLWENGMSRIKAVQEVFKIPLNTIH